MTGGIYRSEFEAMKAPHIMRRRVIYEQWRNRGTIEEALHESLLENVLERPMNVKLMLAKCNLRFRGSSEELSKNNKDNFFSIIQFLAKYDTVLDKRLQLLKDSPKYLSPFIQNEIISVLTKEILRDIKRELQNAPFFAIILNITQNVSK